MKQDGYVRQAAGQCALGKRKTHKGLKWSYL